MNSCIYIYITFININFKFELNMHYFKDNPTDNEIIINNLRLLNYDIKEANITFRLNIESLTIDNMKNHPKLIISIIHFIVYKIVEDESFYN